MKLLLSLLTLPLLAAQTVNLLPFNSSDFSTANWTRNFVQVGSITTLAPDSLSPAQSLDSLADPNLQVHFVRTTNQVGIGHGGSQTVSASVFLKAGTLHRAVLSMPFTANGVNGGIAARFDLLIGQVILVSTDCCVPFVGSASISDAGNGWFRVGVSAQTSAKKDKLDSAGLNVQLENEVGGPYLDTTGQQSAMFIWGAQIDNGTSPLPYQAVP